jgi:hypothetical protein
VIAHIVLFRPRADVTSSDVEGLIAAIERAHRESRSVRRFRVGKRTLRSAPYAAGIEEFPYAALVEFDDLRGLEAYLAHPAHADLGRRFWATSEAATAYDFELFDASDVREALAAGDQPQA